MKIHRYPKAYSWMIVILVILFLMTLSHCRRGQPRPDKTAPEETQTTTAPETAPPKTTPQKPPSKTEQPPSRKPAEPVSKKEVTPTPQEKTIPEEKYFTHTVKWGGETLFIIAAWYTGERDHWRAIAEAMTRENPNVNIHRIRRGDNIPVPESLMKTRDPMPKEFVDNFFQPSKPERPPSKPAPAPKEEEKEPELFGPRDPTKK